MRFPLQRFEAPSESSRSFERPVLSCYWAIVSGRTLSGATWRVTLASEGCSSDRSLLSSPGGLARLGGNGRSCVSPLMDCLPRPRDRLPDPHPLLRFQSATACNGGPPLQSLDLPKPYLARFSGGGSIGLLRLVGPLPMKPNPEACVTFLARSASACRQVSCRPVWPLVLGTPKVR